MLSRPMPPFFTINMLGITPFLLAAADAAHAAPQGGIAHDIVRQFGVDWPYFISQTVSFLLVGAALYFFAIRPLSKVLDQRRQKIEEGLRYTEEMKTRMAAAEKERADLMKVAALDARTVIEKAAEQGKALLEKQTADAAVQAESLLAKAREQVSQEHAAMMADVRREAADLVVRTTTAVLGRALPETERDRVASDAAKTLAAASKE